VVGVAWRGKFAKPPRLSLRTALHVYAADDDREDQAMSKFAGDPDEAEADLRRASDALISAENELTDAGARAETIEQEPFDGSPEEEEDISQRMEVVQREIESLQQDVADAEGELHRTHDHWVDQGYLPS
jgi:chromosome segregation ATPase